MIDRFNLPGLFREHAAMAGVTLCVMLIAAGPGWTQNAPPTLGVQSPAQQPLPPEPAPQQAEPPAAAPADRENPGLINEIGKLFEKSKSILPPIQSPSETLGNLAKPATMVSGRAACVVAANGAPDCKAGADRLCQSKGFTEGKSLDTDASEKCSPIVFLPGHKRGPNDCKTENFVTRALCQ
ncbi:hypothetical protein [Bradyrhizobium jicamae]|uniref:hypothetical protein n=1 Tax=Bradyrhizobium jicamae TaxID=280332 RepID=UPI003D9BCF7F